MLNKKEKWTLGIGIILMAFIFFIAPEMGLFSSFSGSVSRSVPLEVSPGDSLQLTYSVNSQDSKWGVSIVDSISGGCTFSDGNADIKEVVLSEDSNTFSVGIDAPNEETTCTLSGDYKFGTNSLQVLDNKNINVVEGAEDESTIDDGTEEDESAVITPSEDEEWWNNEVFPIGDFSVKMWMLLSAIGGILLLGLMGGKK